MAKVEYGGMNRKKPDRLHNGKNRRRNEDGAEMRCTTTATAGKKKFSTKGK